MVEEMSSEIGSARGVALIGCGAIGSLVAKAIDEGLVNARLLYLLDIVVEKAEELAKVLRQEPRVAREIGEILEDEDVEVVVEAASQEAVLQYAERVLEAGKELVVLSVGALLRPELKHLLEDYGERIHIPSGAIAGLDALRSLVLVGIKRVVLTTRKHPSKLLDSPYARRRRLDLEGVEEPVVVFEGPAEVAVREFPRSLNVAATLALYSGAPVHVRVVADPAATRNVHEVEVESEASRITITVENVPHPLNPKTSYLAALSAISLLRELCASPRGGSRLLSV